MKICIISHEFTPFPGGGIATYHNAAAAQLASAGHDVHVVTNRAWWGRTEPRHTEPLWREGGVTVHRLWCFNEQREPPRDMRFFDVNPRDYPSAQSSWVRHASNMAAQHIAAYVEQLHQEVGLDVIETPEFFAEAFYVIRRRRAGDRHAFPPVCVHGHTSSRLAFTTNEHVWELGWPPHRHLMLREEYCVQNGDALITPSRSLMQKYEQQFGAALPALRAVIPYFLELPREVGELPAGIDASKPYLLCIGRIEPRKGSDLVLRAFAQLAERRDDLQLVFLGKELWHAGEKFADVVEALVPPRHRGRVLPLGNVPREAALAAARAAAAFVHAAPWDNYPCAVLEAMAMGAACVVSDQGGHAEMVERDVSGALFRAGDVGALVDALTRVLDNRDYADSLRRAAPQRAARITDSGALIEQKMQVFEALCQAERRAVDPARQFELPPRFRADPATPVLPGAGLVVLDVAGAALDRARASAASLLVELRGSQWAVQVLVPPHQDIDIGPAWPRFTVHDPLPWHALDGEAPVLWVQAGAVFDRGALCRVVAQLFDSADRCASFPWLRPATARVFPYRQDSYGADLLVGGQVVPPAFAVRAGDLAPLRNLAGLIEPGQRAAAVAAAAITAAGMPLRHVGAVCGDYYGALPVVDGDLQIRLVGFLASLGLVEPVSAVFGNIELAVTLPEDAAAPAASLPRPSNDGKPSAQGAAAPAVSAERLAELERVYRSHTALKQMAVVRWMRGAGVFTAVRRLFPKSREAIGEG